jgi:hypothetical protein
LLSQGRAGKQNRLKAQRNVGVREVLKYINNSSSYTNIHKKDNMKTKDVSWKHRLEKRG